MFLVRTDVRSLVHRVAWCLSVTQQTRICFFVIYDRETKDEMSSY